MNVTVSYKKQKYNSESKYTHKGLSRTKTRGNYKHWLLRLHISSSRRERERDIQDGMQRCWLCLSETIQGEHISTRRKLYYFWHGYKITPFHSLAFLLSITITSHKFLVEYDQIANCLFKFTSFNCVGVRI